MVAYKRPHTLGNILSITFLCNHDENAALGFHHCTKSNVGECTYYQALRMKVFGKEKTTIKSVVEKLNINLLAKYLKQAGRLAEYGQ